MTGTFTFLPRLGAWEGILSTGQRRLRYDRHFYIFTAPGREGTEYWAEEAEV